MHPFAAFREFRLAGAAVSLALTCTLVAAPSAAEEPSGPAPDSATRMAPGRKLDLRLPDITTIFAPEVIDRVLAATRDPDTLEEVEVERERGKALPARTPVIPAGIIAPFWALAHPLEAWRIFLPLPPDQQRYAATPPDASDSYRPVPLPPGF